MAPSFVSDASLDSSRKKRRKLKDDRNPAATTQVRWRSDNEQRIYSTKLVEALQKVRQGSISSLTTAVSGGKTVKEAADRVLAVAAKGTTRWSRAILSSRLRLSRRLQKRRKARMTGDSRCKRADVTRERRMPAVQRKVKVLSRLIPGCRKAPLPNLLEETTDYIAALEMQVRAMTVLTELLSGAPAASRLNSTS
ncbi:transcription factor bHLH147 [Argentina anserina]|uniref:transcription factor bHLH147 n=1 Tax=Argentina anserina TaxID=57926 RepID=UPI0021764CA0|nr:transcription factor bHLH147 [Potentilla anserina]XP_050383348.1 transcription factor bHLH147 [Potentilla anserina]